jgi:hypothetical protein
MIPFIAAAARPPVVQLPARVGELEGERVRRVVAQHVEDEPLLDRLPHGVDVERRGQVARPGRRRRVGPRPNSSSVFAFGVAVKAT